MVSDAENDTSLSLATTNTATKVATATDNELSDLGTDKLEKIIYTHLSTKNNNS